MEKAFLKKSKKGQQFFHGASSYATVKFTKKLLALSNRISIQNTEINLTCFQFTKFSRDEYKFKWATTAEDKALEYLKIKNASEAAGKNKLIEKIFKRRSYHGQLFWLNRLQMFAHLISLGFSQDNFQITKLKLL